MKLFFCKILPILLIGSCAGFVNGLLGAGGGILIVSGLSFLFRDTVVDRRSIFASALAVMLPLSALSLSKYLPSIALGGSGFLYLVLPAVAGGALGAFLLRRVSPRALSRIFAAVLLLSGVVMVA